jgi:hypothetical protein
MPADPPSVAASVAPIPRRALGISGKEKKPHARGPTKIITANCDPLILQAGHPPELAPGPWRTGCRASKGRIPPPLWIRNFSGFNCCRKYIIGRSPSERSVAYQAPTESRGSAFFQIGRHQAAPWYFEGNWGKARGSPAGLGSRFRLSRPSVPGGFDSGREAAGGNPDEQISPMNAGPIRRITISLFAT